MENIVKGDGSEYLDFEEISSKLTSILLKKKLGRLVLKLFSNVERKTGRSRGREACDVVIRDCDSIYREACDVVHDLQE
jgi:hypothetical protein